MLLRYNNVQCTCGGGITGWWDIDLLLRYNNVLCTFGGGITGWLDIDLLLRGQGGLFEISLDNDFMSVSNRGE